MPQLSLFDIASNNSQMPTAGNQSPATIFKSLLLSTQREGIENVISELEKSDFFTAPASTAFHNNTEGGLLDHCLKVYQMATLIRKDITALNPKYEELLPEDSVIIVALLHDVCKANIYLKTTKYRKNEKNNWETYEVYTVNYNDMPLGHGEKSVIQLLRMGLSLTRDEILAIRWHMSAWDLAFQSAEAKGNLNAARDQCPLLCLLSSADGISSALLEE